MHMKEGTIIQAIGINDWENQTGGDFTNIPYEDSIIKISIAPPKHFTIQIYENKKLIHKFVSQPISFKNNGMVFMVYISFFYWMFSAKTTMLLIKNIYMIVDIFYWI